MGLPDDKKTILEKYGPYVRSVAATVRKQFNAQLELEELVAYGQIGLLEAAERFDPKVGANFLTFAHYRIKGSIFDGLRKMGVLRGSDARTASVGERAAAYLGNLADREQGGGNRTRRVDDRLEMRIVEVEGVRRDSVHERRARHVDLLGSTQHGRLRRRLKHPDRRQSRLGGLVPRRTDRAADPVQEGAVRFVLDGVAPAPRRMRGDEPGQDLRDGRGVTIRLDSGVACHGF